MKVESTKSKPMTFEERCARAEAASERAYQLLKSGKVRAEDVKPTERTAEELNDEKYRTIILSATV